MFRIQVLLAVIFCLLPLAGVRAQFTKLEESYQFLVSKRAQGGILYQSNDKLQGAALPLSFVDSAEYWALSVCLGPNFPCVVTDTYDSANFTLTPEPGIAGDMQTERVNVHNGTNIYDAATWQIAVMLGQVANHFATPALSTNGQDAYALASNQNRLLSTIAGSDSASTNLRATTRGRTFRYNERVIDRAAQAYAFRMLPRTWLSVDPLNGTPYGAWVTAKDLPPLNKDYQRGKITWADWKPITGENAWAFLLGPLHAAYIHYVLDLKQGYVPFREPAVQAALAVLPTFAAMQAPIGSIYYAPSGTASNDVQETLSPYQVSVENNFSVYAGLKVLAGTLRAQLENERALNVSDKAGINAALQTIAVMINGGKLGRNSSTAGLLAFFRTQAWQNNEFIQGGIANDPKAAADWLPALQPKAVDTNTWGIAALGAGLIDEWYGFGSAYKNWQQVKTWAAYGVDRKLWGVGYSNQDGNGMNDNGTYKQGILSAEWTAGAITMVRSMIRHYQGMQTPALRSEAQAYVDTLKQDELDMLAGLESLRFDNYLQARFPGKPVNYANLIQQGFAPYLYASKRYLIPFGWYANPLPSTCSTAWVIMLAYAYDPFGYGGQGN